MVIKKGGESGGKEQKPASSGAVHKASGTLSQKGGEELFYAEGIGKKKRQKRWAVARGKAHYLHLPPKKGRK